MPAHPISSSELKISMVSMTTVNAIYTWGCTYKIDHISISSVSYPRQMNLVSI